jgi:transcriptional regulator with XRE-family HTH domain
MKKDIGLRIKAARKAVGLNLQQLSDLTGGQLLPARISNFEQGLREPDAQTIVILASKLEVTPCFLMFGGSGSRSSFMSSADEISGTVGSALDPEEKKLLDCYRDSSLETQAAIELLLMNRDDLLERCDHDVLLVSITRLERFAAGVLDAIKNGSAAVAASSLVERKAG